MPIVVTQPEPIHDHRMSAIVYGESGAGKTTMIGTLENPLVLYTDLNELSLHRIQKPFIRIESWDHLEEIRQWIAGQLSVGEFPYSSIAVDTMSVTETILIRKVAGGPKADLKHWPHMIPIWRDMFQSFLDFSKIGRYVQAIDVILAARPFVQVNENDGTSNVWPDVPGRKLPQEVFAWVDEVFHITTATQWDDNVEVVKHVIYTDDHDGFKAKDGSGALDLIEEPHFPSIREKITKALTGATSGANEQATVA